MLLMLGLGSCGCAFLCNYCHRSDCSHDSMAMASPMTAVLMVTHGVSAVHPCSAWTSGWVAGQNLLSNIRSQLPFPVAQDCVLRCIQPDHIGCLWEDCAWNSEALWATIRVTHPRWYTSPAGRFCFCCKPHLWFDAAAGCQAC